MMEKRKFRLGDYEFDTYKEYLEAQEDLKKIDLITEEVDINDVDVAARLYTRIRNKEIVFHSKIGINFFMYLSDIVANHSMVMVEEKKAQEDLKKKNSKRAKNYRIAGVACVFAAVACFVYFAYADYLEEQSALEMKRLQNMQNMTGHYIEEEDFLEDPDEQMADARDEASGDENAGKTEASDQPEALPEILPEYQEIYEENKDLVGWLQIEGTVINYPVLQSDSEEDSQFYLTHSFAKKKDKNGSLFMDYRNDFVDRDTNIIIYGHNMKSGAMFGSLKKYLDKDYLEKHARIRFDTIYERGTYEVIGAFLSEVSYQDEYMFRYYNFLNANNESEFEAFCVNVMQLDALKNTTLDAEYGDQLLTLSTCSSYTEEGRMFILAKRIK
ncbi:MAG: class B sortase [Lachnospiraceae bacterium]|nr:class B sortase [Lachnospiraceae bacterium]MDD7176912.1 class B sortase [bacterium]MDY5517074.1 class B sortase [Lachnospiraceae bacterium]